MKAIKQPKTLMEAIVFFSKYENCHDFLVSLRWPGGVTCPLWIGSCDISRKTA